MVSRDFPIDPRPAAAAALIVALASVGCSSATSQGQPDAPTSPPTQDQTATPAPAAPQPAPQTEKPAAEQTPKPPSEAQKPAAPPTQKPAAEAQKPAGAPPAAKPLTATSPDGTRIVYEVTGTGPALILLHGGGQTRKSWAERGYVEKLRSQFTVIALDLRGYGDSGKPTSADGYALDKVLADIVAVADAAGQKRFHLMGFGHGAAIGRYLAARSDRVISAVLIGANMGPTLTGVVKDAVVGMRAKWQPLLDAQKAGTFDLKSLSPGDRGAWEGGVAIHAVALGALADYPPLSPAEIKAPALWVVGAADTSALENVKEFEGKLTGTSVTLRLVNGLSYSDSFAKSEPVLAEVMPFLKANAGGSD